MLESKHHKKNKEFITNLHEHVKRFARDIEPVLKDPIYNFTYVECLINDIPELFLIGYKLNSSISFLFCAKPSENTIKYLYNGCIIEPEGYYIIQDNFYVVTVLEMLWESIEQKTHRPSVKNIQNPKNLPNGLSDKIFIDNTK